MDRLEALWNFVVQIHESSRWEPLVLFYGCVMALVVFVCLQLLLLRGRRISLRAFRMARSLVEDIDALRRELNTMEERVDGHLDSRFGELDARVTRKLDQKGDLIQERIEERANALNDAITKLDSRVISGREQAQRLGERIDEVEARIPNLFDKLDEFKNALGNTFQVELSSVLNSFDTSVADILQQMRMELQMGIDRIDNIQSMVESRQRAGRSLMGTATGGELTGALEEEESEFEEWEEEAKELAAQSGEAATDEDTNFGLAGKEPLGEETATDEEDVQYPAEMGPGGTGQTPAGEEEEQDEA
jgi:hypothetical protein